MLVAGAVPARAVVLPGRTPASARVLGDVALTARLHELTIESPSLCTITRARVLLPVSYGRRTLTRYPVLYLLHGADSDYRAWTEKVDAASVTAPHDVIVVMPDAGRIGFYSNWDAEGVPCAPAWEQYHLVELRRILQTRYRTNGRYAVAGQSMGGFGALSYASRHPDLFSAVASFSGAVDTRFDEPVVPWVFGLLTGFVSGISSGIWGDFTTSEVRWRGHNPLDLAPNLRGTAVFLSAGTGASGPLDPPGEANLVGLGVLETAIHAMNVEYSDRLRAVGVAATDDIDRPGTHNLAYGLASLARWMPDIMRALSVPRAVPADFTYRSAERRFSVWGWSFATANDAPTFTDVRVAGDTVSATGRGPLDVTTRAAYRPGGRYLLVDAGGEHPVRADGSGRLRFTVRLGDTAERYSLLPDLPGPRPRGAPVAVSIRPSRAGTGAGR